MAEIRSYRDLQVWQKGMTLASLVYQVSKDFPRDERFGLTAQMRRAAVSVPSNIAEGYGRRSKADYVRFLNVAMGSLFELQTQTEIAANLGHAARPALDGVGDAAREIERMLSSLIRKLTVFLCALVPLCLCPSS